MENKIGIFRAAAAAVILHKDDNRILITQRSLERDHHPGKWEIMSGRLDQGEGFAEAMHREIKEELGIEVEIIDTLDTFHFYRGPEKQEHVGVCFLVRHKSGEVKVDGVEEVDFKWVTFGEVSKYLTDGSIMASIKLAKQKLEK